MDFLYGPFRVKLNLKVDDITGSASFRAFDHVMLSVAAVDSFTHVRFSYLAVKFFINFIVCITDD
jgi:hypothetical protein